MDFRQHLQLMADWNLWCYQRLGDCIDAVTEADYRRDTGLFFRSIHGSVNHMLLVERLWRERLDGQPPSFKTLEDELIADRAALKAALLASAASWRGYVDALSDAELFGEFSYRNIKGEAHRLPRSVIVHTMFTHGAHHRGQVTTALHQLGLPTPVLDYPVFFIEQRNLESRPS